MNLSTTNPTEMNLGEALDTVLEAAASHASSVAEIDDTGITLGYRIETAIEMIDNWRDETFG